MSEAFLLVLSIILAVVVGGLVTIVRLQKSESSELSVSQLDVRDQANSKEETDLASKAVEVSPFRRLRYEEALDMSVFSEALTESVLASINGHLARSSGFALESLKLITEQGEIRFSLSQQGQEQLSKGTAKLVHHKKTGKILPTIQNNRGNYVEQFKGVPPSTANKLLKVGTLVVSASHVISGMDVAKKLDGVKADTEFLIAVRKIDQEADLETIFLTTREALDLDPKTRERILERNYYKISRLRTRLRRELEHKLEQVDNPEKWPKIKRIFSRKKSREKGVVKKTTKALASAHLVDISLAFQTELANLLGRTEAFQRNTMPHEVQQLRSLKDQICECESYLSGKYEDEGVELTSTREHFEFMIEKYKPLCLGSEITETVSYEESSEEIREALAKRDPS